MKLTRLILLMTLLMTCGILSSVNFGSFVRADDAGTADEDASVETEDEVVDEGQAEPGTGDNLSGGMPPEAEPEVVVGPADDVDTSFLFPKYDSDALPGGKRIQCLISFHNSGATKKTYHVEEIVASLRYPMDFNFYLRNFTALTLNQTVEVNREVSFNYYFDTSEHFTGRPFGFVLEMKYSDSEGNPYLHNVYNKTMNFYEIDEPFDAEAIMLYVFFAAVVFLIAIVFYYSVFGSSSKKSSSAKKSGSKLETGRMEMNGGVHNEWLPAHARKSPKVQKPLASPKASKKSKKDL